MANQLAAEVFNNLPHLLHNPDRIQPLLNLAYAEFDRNNVIGFEVSARMLGALRLEAELRALPAPTEEERNKHAAIVAVIDGLAATGVFLLKQQWLLFQVIGLLLLVRAWSRAHLLPGLLLAAVSAAVVLHVSTGGGVVPGSRSFVRFFVLMLDFLFASNRPRRAG